jgi:hypothetical protein
LRTKVIKNVLQAGVLVVVMAWPVRAQAPADPLSAVGLFGFQSLVDGPPSRSGFPPPDCPTIRKHVAGRASNDWTPETLPDGCRVTTPPQDDRDEHSRFQIRTYIDIATVGWDDTYSAVIPSIAGFHVSFVKLGTWTLGAGGLLASLSPVFDLRTGTQQYQLSPRLNVFNLNKALKPLTAHYDLCISVEATRELFMPAAAAFDGSRQFNNVFGGISISPRPR